MTTMAVGTAARSAPFDPRSPRTTAADHFRYPPREVVRPEPRSGSPASVLIGLLVLVVVIAGIVLLVNLRASQVQRTVHAPTAAEVQQMEAQAYTVTVVDSEGKAQQCPAVDSPIVRYLTVDGRHSVNMPQACWDYVDDMHVRFARR